MADRSVVVRLRAEVDRYVAGMKQAQDATTQLGKELTGQGKATKQQLDQIGNAATVMAGGMVLAFGASVKAAIDWESAFAGVEKTVDGTAAQMANLEAGLRDMAKELPASHAEIAAVAEAAGQLGIRVEDVEGFTRTMIDLGETTNMSAEVAATSLARFMNIMGTSTSEVDRLGSTIVELGNNAATTEAEIVDMAMRIAGAGNQIGLTEAEVFGFASTLSSLGVEAEAGGSAISRVMIEIASEVETSGDKLADFARVSGMSVEEFSRLFRDDAAGAVLAFVNGLGNAEAQGSSTLQMLDDLGFTEIRVRDALLRLAGGGELLAEQLGMANEAFAANTALQIEAEKRYDTTAAQLGMLRNQVVDLGIDIGGALLPAVNAAIDVFGTFAAGLSAMPGPMQTALLGIGGIATVAAAGTAALVKIVPKIREMRAALIALGPAGRVAAASMPWLAAAGAAVAALTYVMGRNAEAARAAEERMKGYSDAIQSAGDAVLGTTSQIASLVAESDVLADLLNEAGVKTMDLGAALAGTDAEWERMRDRLLETAEASGITGLALDGLRKLLDGQREAAIKGAEHAEKVAEANEGVGGSAAGAAPAVNALGEELGITAEQAEEAEKALKAYLTTLRAAFDPVFGFLDAIDKNREAQEKYNEAVASGTATQAELDAMLRDVAKSALDVEGAAMELHAAFVRGEVSAEEFAAGLARLVAQGGITQQQADALMRQFGLTNAELERFDGDYVARLYQQGADEVERKVRNVSAWLDAINRSVTARIQVQLNNPYARVTGPQLGFAGGGVVPQYLAGGGTTVAWGPRGTDTVPAMLTPGEFVVRREVVNRFGVGFFDALNAGRITPAAPAAAGGGTARVVIDVVGQDQDMVRMLRRAIRVEGGDVQVVLGS